MKIIILGGHGFVGSQVTELLKESRHEVLPLSRKDGLDLTDYENTESKFKKTMPDLIINCAAHVGSLHYVTENAATVVDENMQMILNIYRAAKNISTDITIINPISNCSYPGDADVQRESEWWNGPVHQSVWSYGNMKRMLAVVSDCYAIQHKMKSINFLVANTYGPGDTTDPNKTHALNGMIIRMLHSKNDADPEFEIWGSGKPMREWIYIADLGKLLVDAISSKVENADLINLAQNNSYSIKDTAEMIKELSGYSGKLVFNTEYQDGAPKKQLDDTLFRKKYPNFTFTEMKKGIENTIKYYKKELNIS